MAEHKAILQSEKEFNTLDEPVLTTITRDLKAIGIKFAHVLYPKQKNTILRDWDLWGPLILCVFLAMMLQQPDDEKNTQGRSSVCPDIRLGVARCRHRHIELQTFGRNDIILPECTVGLFILRFFVTMLGFGWAVFASTAFLADSQPSSKKALAVYPICLFYFVISWLILARSP
ncbi:hypothetical protein MRX96_041355 [Rhipicephalus microplus]